MKLRFAYDLDKDVENVIKGAKAINSQKSTKFQNLFTEKYGNDFEAGKVGAFIQEQDKITNLDIKQEVLTVQEKWQLIEELFVKRVEKIFNLVYPEPIITVYLTHNERCTYNLEGNYFFVKIGSPSSNHTIMHELFHFYTWQAFGKKLLDEGLDKLKYNELKESLTELLNLEFADLLGGALDKGYPQHQELRQKIRDLWSENKDPFLLIKKLLN